MDDFDSQRFLQLARTIPDGAGLGLTLPSTSLAPDQGQGLQPASATGQDPTPPQDLAAAAATAFQPRPFSIAAPNQAAPPADQSSAASGSVQPSTDASSIDSQSLIRALRQMPAGAGSDWAGLSNNTSPDQGYSPQPSPSESRRSLLGQQDLPAPKGSDQVSIDEAHPYAPVPGPSETPEPLSGNKARVPTQTRSGASDSGYTPPPDRPSTSPPGANQEGVPPRGYSPQFQSAPQPGPSGYGPQRTPSDSSEQSQSRSQDEPFNFRRPPEPGTTTPEPSSPVSAPKPESPADNSVEEPAAPATISGDETNDDHPSGGRNSGDDRSGRLDSKIDKGHSNFIPSHDPSDPDQADEFEPRLPNRFGVGKTHGVIESDGKEIYLRSQIKGRGYRFFDRKKKPNEQAATHVEAHAVGVMIVKNLKEITLTINNRNGPCWRCEEEVPKMLPPGKTLRVNWQDIDGRQWTTIFQRGLEPRRIPLEHEI